MLYFIQKKFFGSKWRNYIKNVVNKRVTRKAKESLALRFLPKGFKNKIFIDVDHSNGIFSLSTLLLGVKNYHFI